MAKPTKPTRPAKPAKQAKPAGGKLDAVLDCPPGLSYAKDIRPLFNDQERACMKNPNNGPFDLYSYSDVKAWSSEILIAVSPPAAMPLGLPKWTPKMVNTFACWIQQGCQP